MLREEDKCFVVYFSLYYCTLYSVNCTLSPVVKYWHTSIDRCFVKNRFFFFNKVFTVYCTLHSHQNCAVLCRFSVMRCCAVMFSFVMCCAVLFSVLLCCLVLWSCSDDIILQLVAMVCTYVLCGRILRSVAVMWSIVNVVTCFEVILSAVEYYAVFCNVFHCFAVLQCCSVCCRRSFVLCCVV